MSEVAKKKNGFAAGLSKYARDTRAELKKVIWPTWKQLVNNTGIVIAAIVIIGVIIFGLDSLFGFIFGKLILG